MTSEDAADEDPMVRDVEAWLAANPPATLKTKPTELTRQLRLAPSGEGPRAVEWSDKPHRLLYDACTEIERLTATPKPEPVLRWEEDKLWLGEHYIGEVEALPDNDGRWAADVRLGWKSTFHDTREGATAWVETEVHDWLKRAGCV